MLYREKGVLDRRLIIPWGHFNKPNFLDLYLVSSTDLLVDMVSY
jgi:hypothetical protein